MNGYENNIFCKLINKAGITFEDNGEKIVFGKTLNNIYVYLIFLYASFMIFININGCFFFFFFFFFFFLK